MWARISLVLITVLAASGCGASRVTHRTPARNPPPGPQPPYRWLVRISGPPPTIAAENRARGTRAWQLRGAASEVGGRAYGTVAGYVSRQAVAAGQTERIYVSAPGSKSVQIQIFRIGWYHGAGGRLALMSKRLRVRAQPSCTRRPATGLTECNWHSTLSFRIPPALPSGVYIVRMSARTGAADCMFVVRATRPQPLLVQLPTSTYEAYNAWGGNSLYSGGHDRVGITRTTQGIAVSYERPYDSISGAGQFFARDVAIVGFLERYGYPVSYTTSESIDRDPGQVFRHRALIDAGHSEYWSQRQELAFRRARDAGESLLFFSSDTLAWRVRYSPPARTLVAYKEHALLDRDRAQPSGAFPDGGASLTGSAYTGCITPRLHQPGPPTYHYYAWRPASPLRPAWLFAHTHITAATRIPGIVGYELDARTPFSPPWTIVVGSGFAVCGERLPGEAVAYSGYYGVADTTLYTARSGAVVFTTGTLGWELGLEPVPNASPDAPRAPDPRVVAMTRNLLGYVLRTRRR